MELDSEMLCEIAELNIAKENVFKLQQDKKYGR